MSNFLSDAQLPFSWRRLAEDALCYVYNGSSMLPTFHPGQLLLVKPLGQPPVRGDVIIFSDPACGRNVVHRVISVSAAQQIRTRGDNNPRPDASFVSMQDVLGRVEQAEKAGGLRSVDGGWRGLWRARVQWSMLWAWNLVRTVFGSLYRSLRQRRWVACLWKPKIQRLELGYQNGMWVKYLHAQCTVATWQPAVHKFECKKPYDLVIPSPEMELW